MLIKAGRADLRIGNIEGGYRPRVGASKLDTWSDGWRHLKLIVLLAPDIFLVVPGLVLAALGVLALLMGFVQPTGVEIGSARWQPVFFSGIALVLGLQMFVAGAVVANTSPLARPRRHSYAFLQDLRWPRRAVEYGLLLAALGVLIDAGLFFWWVLGTHVAPTMGARFALASLAQTLMILGGSMAVFGVVLRFARGLDRASSASRSGTRGREPAHV